MRVENDVTVRWKKCHDGEEVEAWKDGGRFLDILAQQESKGNFAWNLQQLQILQLSIIPASFGPIGQTFLVLCDIVILVPYIG